MTEKELLEALAGIFYILSAICFVFLFVGVVEMAKIIRDERWNTQREYWRGRRDGFKKGRDLK